MKYISMIRIIVVLFAILSANVAKGSDFDKLFRLSFEELMNIEVVSSSFTGLDKIKEPASVTVITKNDIAVAPARNIYDLLEIYVPGAIWMTHYDSPHVGIRGIINQRNDKILLLVNGKNMNFKARNGATSELENWDLNDIERIEVVRGPGSVIYGPGAVQAVIKITTKQYDGIDTYNASIGGNFPYNSYSGNFTMNKSINDNISFFAFGSLTSTKGYSPERGYYIQNNHNIYDLDKPNSFPEDRPFQDYLVDTYNKPQLKAHLQFNLFQNTDLWIRYTNSGSTYNGLTHQYGYQQGFDEQGNPIIGKPSNNRNMNNEQFVVSIENDWKFNDKTSLLSFFSFDSENNRRSQDYIQIYWDTDKFPLPNPFPKEILSDLANPYSLRNQYFAVAETELLARFLVKHTYNERLAVALGTEYSYNSWGSMWFKNKDYFRLGDRWNILTTRNSPAYGFRDQFGTDTNDTYLTGNGWSTNTISLFGEANYTPIKSLTLLLSGRLDKDDYSNLLVSPRLAAILTLSQYNYLKFIAQRSLRMNTAEELFIQHSEGNKSREEALDNIELIYTSLQGTDLIINLSAFANKMKVLTWLDPIRSTVIAGSLTLIGFEFDSRFQCDNMDLLFNHSYVKQIDWKLEPGVNESGVSYSDFNISLLGGSTLTGHGNDLNNWSNHVTKLAVNFKFMDSRLLLHLNTRIYWDFQGSKDGIDVIRRGAVGNADSAAFIAVADLIEKYNTFDIDARLNASISYALTNSLELGVYIQNILNLTDNKRLRYDSGSKKQWLDAGTSTGLSGYVNKTSLIIEPFMISAKLSFRF